MTDEPRIAVLLVAAAQAALRRLGRRGEPAAPAHPREPRPRPHLGPGRGAAQERVLRLRRRPARPRRQRLVRRRPVQPARIRARRRDARRASSTATRSPSSGTRSAARWRWSTPACSLSTCTRSSRSKGSVRGSASRRRRPIRMRRVDRATCRSSTTRKPRRYASLEDAVRSACCEENPHLTPEHGAAPDHPRHAAERRRHAELEVRQLRAAALAVRVQHRRGAGDLEPDPLPRAARPRVRELGVRPRGGRQGVRVPRLPDACW